MLIEFELFIVFKIGIILKIWQLSIQYSFIEHKSNIIAGNLIYGNSQGIYCGYDIESRFIEIYCNTIVNNDGSGIYGYSSEDHTGDPNVNSNVIWGNGTNLSGTFTKVKYNCIQGCTETNGNINDNPEFFDADANDFHLTADSNCINAGNPNLTSSLYADIDGEDRIINSRVDIGADEFNPYDLSQDGFVNFEDFVIFAEPWKKSSSKTGYNDNCDFYNDNTINTKDLRIFCEYWLTPDDWSGIGGEGAYFEEGGSDDFGRYDLLQDGVIDFSDFSIFALAWQTSAGQNAFYSRCDFYDDGRIDYKDLLLFSAHWLWPLDRVVTSAADVSTSSTVVAEEGVESNSVDLNEILADIQDANDGTDYSELIAWLEAMGATSENTEDSNDTESEVFDANAAVDWLEDLWVTDSNISGSIDANDWQEFLDSIESSE